MVSQYEAEPEVDPPMDWAVNLLEVSHRQIDNKISFFRYITNTCFLNFFIKKLFSILSSLKK